MTIEEVYEKYKHLDHLLSDKEWLGESFYGYFICDMWAAIKTSHGKEEGDGMLMRD
jgi:hypothetical protein